MTSSTQNILVTGGAGFIGSHLTDALLSQGHSVRILDNFSTGKMENLPTEHPALEIIKADIQDKAAVDQATQDIDTIVHLAAVASVQASVEDPVSTHGSNFLGTLNLLEACKARKIKRFVYASSAAVYGDVKTLPVTEDTPLNPLTPYASDKLAGEYYLDFYQRTHGLEPAIFRFFNVFGPRQDPSSPYSGVISIFTDRALAGKDLTVFGDGEQTRDFIYINDLVEILTKATTTATVSSGATNVGTGTSTSLNTLIHTLEDIRQQPLTVHYEPARSGDIKHSLADITRLKTLFQFKAEFSFTEGLKRLLKSEGKGKD